MANVECVNHNIGYQERIIGSVNPKEVNNWAVINPMGEK
jgi:hypothetical protein